MIFGMHEELLSLILVVFGLCFAGDVVVGVVEDVLEDVLDIVPVPAASNEMR